MDFTDIELVEVKHHPDRDCITLGINVRPIDSWIEIFEEKIRRGTTWRKGAKLFPIGHFDPLKRSKVKLQEETELRIRGIGLMNLAVPGLKQDLEEFFENVVVATNNKYRKIYFATAPASTYSSVRSAWPASTALA